jgi:hypothetical protein
MASDDEPDALADLGHAHALAGEDVTRKLPE